ncbi:MAG: DUF1080 domain-containing protein, partial [Ktedonobacteraceae bacterium]|nr:DUF1080 domain-containing protein [Ktedonobacteraceae bacterium]
LRATGMIGVLVLFVVGVLFSAGYVTLLWRDGGSLGSPISASINSSTVDLLGQRAHWPVSSTYFYDTQGYHILNRSPDHVALALYDEQPFSNFHLEVTMVSIKEAGGAFYGVVFRCAPDQSSFYLLEIGRGQYLFLRVEGSQVHYLASGRSADILTGAGKANTLAIEARGNAFAFYINGKPLGKTVVDTLKPVRKGGQVGLYVEDQDMEVSFSHLYVKELK